MSTFQGNGHANKLNEATPGRGGAPLTPEATLVHGALAGSVAGQAVAVENSLVGVAIAGEMTAQDTLILLGLVGSVKGDARVVISPQAALALGVALGVTLALLGRLLRFRKRD